MQVYLALPAGRTPTIIHEASAPGASILELGCGPGRITRVLVAYGHAVTAVDDSEEMLAHVTGAERVCADIATLDLDRRFDTVVLGSGLMNRPTSEWRENLLKVARRHLHDDGVVIVERYAPGHIDSVGSSSWHEGPVDCHYRRVRLDGTVVTAVVTYRFGGAEWRQRFKIEDVSEAQFAVEGANAGFAVVEHLDEGGRWVRLKQT